MQGSVGDEVGMSEEEWTEILATKPRVLVMYPK